MRKAELVSRRSPCPASPCSRRSPLSAVVAFGLAVLVARPARATNITEFPDNGSEQEGRGGAWIARASDPLATMFNPAGLAGQNTRITVQSNIIFEHTCFTRVRSALDTSVDPLAGANGDLPFPKVCNDTTPNINPQIGLTWRATDRLGIGFLLIPPSSGGVKQFPDFVPDGTGTPQASPARYLVIKQSGIILFPTIGAGYEVIDGLRLGASVSWGVAKLKLATATMSLNSDGSRPDSDVRANLQVKDYFVPAFTLGALWSATPEIDIGAWYKWSDSIRASGDLGTAANFYTRANAMGDSSGVRYGDTIFEDCGTGLPTTACGSGNNASFKLAIPMEAKLGARFHKPRATVPAWAEGKREHVRDPLSTDVFDIEANLTWANNSAIDVIQIHFPGDETGKGTLPVAGVQGGEIPPNVDQLRNYKDVFGLRVGGDYNVLPDQLALRAGGFVESAASDARYQTTDFVGSTRFGLALGGTYRIRLGSGERTSAVEIMAAYGHVFFTEQNRNDPNATGLNAVAGTSCNGGEPVSPDKCSDGSARYRTKWPVNLGTITNSMNVINVGLAYRF